MGKYGNIIRLHNIYLLIFKRRMTLYIKTRYKNVRKNLKSPPKLINTCKTCVQKTRSAVRLEETWSSFYKNKTRLTQGDFLTQILFNLTLQKVIQSIKMVPSGIKIGKEQLNVLAYADDIALIGKNETEIRQLFVEIENIARKLCLHINQGKTKHTIVEQKNSSKRNKRGQLKIKIIQLKELKILNI